MTETFFSKRPAVRFVVLLILGIVLANLIPIPSNSRFILLLLLVLAVVILAKSGKAPVPSDVCLQLLLVTVGYQIAATERDSAAGRKLDPVQEEPVRVIGRIESEPVRQEKKITFVLNAELIQRGEERDFSRRRILTTLRKINSVDSLPVLQCGTQIVARVMLEPFPFPRNPGDFDYGRFLMLNDIQGIATIADPSEIVVSKESSFSNVNAFIGFLQRTLYGAIDRFHSPEQSSFLKGVILGYRADLSTEMKQSFVNTGTTHILAVSGSNVAVIVLVLYGMFNLLRLPKKAAGVATIVGIVVFMLVTGSSPSVFRATIMAIVILLGTMLERKTDVYNSLAVAAFIILLLDPNSLFDVGFQLSFAAVLSIVYFYPILLNIINLIPERFEEIKALDYLLKLLAVSLAAQIGTLPFTAYYFGRVSIVSLVANLIVVPLSGFNVLLGIATVAIAPLNSFCASCYAALNSVAMSFLLGFVKVSGNVSYAFVETTRFTVVQAFVYYIIVAALFHLNRPRIVKWSLIALLAVFDFAIIQSISAHRVAELIVTVNDVGQGDAILVELPNGKSMLIDAGPKEFRYDAGEKVLVPVLARKGINRIDALLVTHSHSDHIGGIPFIVGHVPVASLVESGVAGSSALYAKVKDDAITRRIQIHLVERGERIDLDSTVRFYVLNPERRSGRRSSLNNTSVVLKLVYGKTSILLVGDADNEAEDLMCSRYGNFLRADILKVGHHGSSTSSGEWFLQNVRPSTALISVGIKNKFGHPSAEIIERFRSEGSEIQRTDRDGALVFVSDAHHWRQFHWRDNQVPQGDHGTREQPRTVSQPYL